MSKKCKKVSMKKKYEAKDGCKVKLVGIFKELGDYPVIAIRSSSDGEAAVEEYTLEGTYYAKGVSSQDLVEVHPLKDLPTNSQIFVRNSKTSHWHKRHFAGLTSEGLITTFALGRTEFSSGDFNTGLERWKCYKLPSTKPNKKVKNKC